LQLSIGLRSAVCRLHGLSPRRSFAILRWQPYSTLGATTGGSHGAATAAIAARVAPAALVTDTLGDARLPAALCGVVAFRPSAGRWPLRGMWTPAPTLSAPAVLARTVEDAQLLARVLDGRCSGANAAGEMEAEGAAAAPCGADDGSVGAPPSLAGVRIGVLPSPATTKLHPAVQETMDAFLSRLRAAGAEVVGALSGDPADDGAAVTRLYT
jgi:Asp-tRNA(Asn)/Glu-tRNA(Gln) amidotransferase A subunit family amidase